MKPLSAATSNNFADVSFGSPVLQSTFNFQNDSEHHHQSQLNGSRATLSFGDASSFKWALESILI
jgi:hypothetical protein